MLRSVGIEVVENVLAEEARDLLAGYLSRSLRKRPEITLKLAISEDGAIGRKGEGGIRITGDAASAQVHLMRAEADAIMVGSGTALADNPLLTCRLPGLEDRSPARVVLDSRARLPLDSRLVRTARDVPLFVAVGSEAPADRVAGLVAAGATILATEQHQGGIALPELMEDLASRGTQTVLVEGGATVARSLLNDSLVDRITLFRGSGAMGPCGVAAPLTFEGTFYGFREKRRADFGTDSFRELVRE